MTREEDKVRDAMYAQHDWFVRLTHEIHEHPQLAFTEDYAAARITEVLASEGFNVRKGVYGMPTSFVATIGNGPLHVACCAEYDALPVAVVNQSVQSQQGSRGLLLVGPSPLLRALQRGYRLIQAQRRWIRCKK